MSAPTHTHFQPSILAIDHVGLRVSDRSRAMAFYRRLGFIETADFPDLEANEMVSANGVRINLIFNATRYPHNPLLDAPVKLPGFTHPAFIVDDLYALAAWFHQENIPITEQIHPIGPRRIALFIRDPDGNVLEFDQLLEQATIEAKTNKEDNNETL